MDDLVKRARDVLEGATNAPWVTVWDGPTWGWLEVKGPSFSIGAPTRATDLGLADEMQRKADARFIAASRDLVPAMADRIEAQAAEIARLHHKFNNALQMLDEQDREYNRKTNALIDRHAEQVARMREALHCARAICDTPIARRKLGIDPNTDERLLTLRATIGDAQ